MTERLSDERIEELLALEAAATPGEWQPEQTVHIGESYGIRGVETDHEDGVENAAGSYSQTVCQIPHGLRTFRNPPVANMRLIAAARNSLRSLLMEVRERREIERGNP